MFKIALQIFESFLLLYSPIYSCEAPEYGEEWEVVLY
jgi:hypothetical protein